MSEKSPIEQVVDYVKAANPIDSPASRRARLAKVAANPVTKDPNNPALKVRTGTGLFIGVRG